MYLGQSGVYISGEYSTTIPPGMEYDFRDDQGTQWGPYTPCPGQPTEAARALLNNAPHTEILKLFNGAPDGFAREALRRYDPQALAWSVAGGDDCRVTSDKGKAFTASFWTLYNQWGIGGGTTPGGSSGGTTPGGSSGGTTPGGSSAPADPFERYGPYILGAVGVALVLFTSRKR